MSLVLRSFSCLPYESLKLYLDRYLTWKTCFLLALASVILVSDSHSFFRVHHLKRWRSCTLLFLFEFVARPRAPLSMIHTSRSSQFHRWLTLWTEQYRLEHLGLFVSVTKKKKRASLNTISFWIRLMVSDAYQSVSDEDWRPIKVKAHNH